MLNMWRHFLRFKHCKLNQLVIYLVFFLIIICLYQYFQVKPVEKIIIYHSSGKPMNNIRTHDFRLYPQSRSEMEYDRIQIDNVVQRMFSYPENEENKNIDSSKILIYSESIFRSASFPILWLDNQGDVHWNSPAQEELLNYLVEKQYPNASISSCLTRQLFILEQWPMGFFSRHHCFIEHFGQTLYSPSMVLLSPRRFQVSHSSNEDFRNEGILRYYQSISLCSSYLNQPELKTLQEQLPSIGSNSFNTKIITNINQLLERDESKIKFKYSREIWKFGYDHVPHRRWLFDRNRNEIQKKLTYSSPIQLFIDHSNEHIYYNPTTNLTTWVPRNSPQGLPKDVLPG